MESIRRQIHDESTMITLLDRNLDNDQRELDALNDAETIRAEQVCLFEKNEREFKVIYRLNV
jgi:hypothetical protein